MKLPFRYMSSAFLIAFTAFLLAAGVTVFFWLGAVWGVAIFLATMAPILGYAAIGGLIFDPTKAKDGLVDSDSPAVSDRIRGMTVPILASALPFALLLASWHAPAVRALVTRAGGALHYRALAERGLAERAPKVALAGCEAVSEMGGATSRDLIISRLFESADRELVECLLNALPSEPSHDVSLRLEMLAAGWEKELWSEGIDPNRACNLADHLRQAERSGASLAAPRLLLCAVAAPDGASRTCCTQALRSAMSGAPSVASILPSAERTTVTSGIINRVEHLIAAERRADPDARAMLGLEEPEFEAWSHAVACESLKIWRADVRDRAGSAFAESLEPTCSYAPPDESTVGIWNQACSEAVEELNPREVGPAICEGLESRFTAQAVAVARNHLSRARRKAARPPERMTLFQQIIGLGLVPGDMSDTLERGNVTPGDINLRGVELLEQLGSDDPRLREFFANFGEQNDAGGFANPLDLKAGPGSPATNSAGSGEFDPFGQNGFEIPRPPGGMPGANTPAN